MDDIKLIYERLKATRKAIENRIYFAYESDECTQCFRQGLEDALEECEWLFSTIEEVHARRVQDEKLTSKAEPSEGQLPLPEM